MKTSKGLASLLLGLLLLSAGNAAAQHITGNGAPSGAHYNLNIIGHDNCPGGDFTDSNRHSIHVALNGKSKIMLTEGDFQVLDGSACRNGDTAIFQLPANPFTCNDLDPNDGIPCDDPTFQSYWVYARALGGKGGSAVITTCATDPDTGEVVCSSENTVDVLVRPNGKSTFTNVTKELTTLVVTIDVGGVVQTVRIGLFDGELQDYFWDYDNDGLRLAQLRFYPIPD